MFIVRFIIIIIELLVCYVLQSSVWSSMTINNVVPDLLMVVVVAVSYIKGSNAGIIYGFCAGLLFDLTYGTHLGFFALLYLLMGSLAGTAHKFYRKDDNITPLFFIAVCIFLSQSVYYVTEFMLRGRLEYGFYLVNIILPKIVYTVLIASVLYKLVQLSISWSVRFEERSIRNYD